MNQPTPVRQLLVLFVTVISAFTLLAWRVEVNSGSIKDAAAQYQHDQAVAKYVGCLQGVQIITKFNTLFDDLAQVSRDTLASDPNADPAILEARRRLVRIYEGGIVTLPPDACGDDPR